MQLLCWTHACCIVLALWDANIPPKASHCFTHAENPTLDSVEKMVWAEACLKESLRLYPSAPVGGRQAQQVHHMPAA